MELIPVCDKQALMQAGCSFSPNTLRHLPWSGCKNRRKAVFGQESAG
ncbi:hypothetical protein DMNBHIDG_02575 [Candidatus Methanoperedenaceae archaeon GB37]|nr:hypothetical protein DMNBHIDG_02575 [Candidatus Methanoperedenaceae archaeon GB37]